LGSTVSGSGAHAGQVEPVDRLGHLVQTALVLGAVGGVLRGRFQKGIDGVVEFVAGVGNIVRLVKFFTALKRLVGAHH
jgi:hypothetical protein